MNNSHQHSEDPGQTGDTTHEQGAHTGRPSSFSWFILKDPVNRKYLLIALGAGLVQFIIFKCLYPYADFFTDSYSYIATALHNDPVGFRQTGYSRFLSIVHHLTRSDTALVFFQYMLMELAALYFFFTILYFFRLPERLALIFFLFLFFDPALLYLSDYVSSDALFAAISLVWITQLLWIINKPRLYQVFVQALCLLLAFNIRYSAMFYPLVATVAFLLSRQRAAAKITGIMLSLLVVSASMWYTTYLTWKHTGTRTFSAFSGWQLANNVLHIYPHIRVDTTGLPPVDREVNSIVKRYFDTTHQVVQGVTTSYMWQGDMPLKRYLQYYMASRGSQDYFTAWNAVGPIFSAYAWQLIWQHPIAFARYYLLPNTKTYLLPLLECMQVYNGGNDRVDEIAVSWFNYRTTGVTSISKHAQEKIVRIFPVLFLIGNILFIIAFIWLLKAKMAKDISSLFFSSMLVMSSFIMINAAFSIFATMNILRYELLPMIIIYAFLIIVLGAWLNAGRRPGPSSEV